jgi:hypothetical protein
MDASELLSSAVEMALNLLEKNGSFLPFCKAVNAAGKSFIYTPESAPGRRLTEVQASEGVRTRVLCDLRPRELEGIAFCHHSRIRFADSNEKVPAVEVEVHYRGQRAAIWYFPYEIDGMTARVLEYYANDAKEDLFAE